MESRIPFVHLRVESEYSFPNGLCRVEALAERAAADGHSVLGLADRSTLHAAPVFHDAARARGVKPVLGCSLAFRGAAGDPRANGSAQGRYRLTLLAETLEGWQNLVHLVSEAHLAAEQGAEPTTGPEELAQRRPGLIALSGFEDGSPVDLDAARASAEACALSEILGADRFFLEYHVRADREPPLCDAIAGATGIPVAVTAAVQFLDGQEAEVQPHVRAIRGADPAQRTGGLPLLRPEAVCERCRGREPGMALAAEIAARCTVELPRQAPLRFPRFDLPEDARIAEGPPGQRLFAFLEQRCAEGAGARYGLRDPDRPAGGREEAVAARLRHELDIIRRTGFVQYFLVVWDIVRFARARGIAVGPGRGSGAGSLAAYVLGITGIDPLRHGLLFERFLNPERVSPPDFDIDFDPERRDEVFRYVRDRYGRDCVAHIVTFHRLGARAAVRDAVRVLGLKPAIGDRLARRIPEDAQGSSQRGWWSHPELQAAARSVPGADEAIVLARAIEGLPRNSGTHAAGVVISAEPLSTIVPLMRDRAGEILTQYEMGPLAQTGLLKMDFLGLTTLTVIEAALRHIGAAGSPVPDLESLSSDDRRTFEGLSRGDTIGVFQLESAGMRDLLRRVRVSTFEELTAIIALYRPGPMHLLDVFVQRGGQPEADLDHPLLEPIVAETRGILLYQEQVQQVAHVLAGFTLAQGDLLRRAIAKKAQKDMSAQRVAFVEGCRKRHRIARERAERIFDAMERFAGYGFNKSHSVAYATLSYRCAWLKAHYPAAFMAAWLTSQAHDADKLRAGFAEWRAKGRAVLPPDIQRSEVGFRIEGEALRFGLGGLRHVGRDLAEAVGAEREASGPFCGLLDFCVRMQGAPGLTRAAVESLVKAGAFDGGGLSRGRLVAGVEAALAHGARVAEDRASGQMALFSAEAEAAGDETLPAEGADAWSDAALAVAEHETLGVCLTGHPLAPFEWFLRRCGWVLPDAGDAACVVRMGIVARIAPEPGEGEGGADRLRISLDAPDGSVEGVLSPRQSGGVPAWLREGRLVAAVVRGRKDGDAAGGPIEILRTMALQIPPEEGIQEVRLHVGEALLRDERLRALGEVLRTHAGEAPLVLALALSTGERVFIRSGDPKGVAVSEAMVRDVEAVLGLRSVYMELIWPGVPGRGSAES